MAPALIVQGSDTPQSFYPPLWDGQEKTTLELIEYNIKHNANHPVFQYADSNGNLHCTTWIQIAAALQFIERHIHDGFKCDTSTNLSEPRVIGILANLNPIIYFCLIYGILLARYVPFPISPRNSKDGVVHLLSKANCRALFVGNDHRSQELYNTSVNNLTDFKLLALKVPGLSSLLSHQYDLSSFKTSKDVKISDVYIIYHSSGSSGNPKPIPLTHEMALKRRIVLAQNNSRNDISGDVVSMHLPLYHMMAHGQIIASIVTGRVLSVFSPLQDTVLPSPESVLQDAIATQSNSILTLPFFLEAWSKNPQHIEALKNFKSIWYSGGPLLYEVGENLLREGVPLRSSYGTTETGPLATTVPTSPHTEWDWLKTHPGMDLVFSPIDGSLHKLIVKDNEHNRLPVSNTSVDGVPAYDTSDIVARHPNDPTLWKVVGREDTLIMHSSGEKTNPVPIEEQLQRHDAISFSVMFGREQLRPGVIILPSESYTFDSSNPEKVSEYIDVVWKYIQEVNSTAPEHSRIFKEMIIIANPNRPFELTEKGYPKRHAVLKEYQSEIIELYSETENTDDNNHPTISENADIDTLKLYIRSIVFQTLSKVIKDDDNVFACGADSLCAMSIRNTLLRLLPKKQLPSNSSPLLPPDILFTHPTITSLISFIYDLPIWVKEPQTNPGAAKPNILTWIEVAASKRASSGMIKFREGDNPLVLLPDVSGSPFLFTPFQELYTSAVWSFDITREPPEKFTSVSHIASYYFDVLKKEKPTGPYRFASFSGSSVILLCLVKLLEKAGDKVTQVAFLDHFPSAYLLSINNPESFHPITDLESYLHEDSYQSILRGAGTEGTPYAYVMKLLADALRATLDNKPVNPLMADTMKRIKNSISICIQFLFGDEFRKDGVWKRELYDSWLRSMSVVPTVYLATDGICKHQVESERLFATGLGATEAYPGARVVVVPGYHADVLISEVVVNDLLKGCIKI